MDVRVARSLLVQGFQFTISKIEGLSHVVAVFLLICKSQYCKAQYSEPEFSIIATPPPRVGVTLIQKDGTVPK